jgi:uncharacterized membrane protein
MSPLPHLSVRPPEKFSRVHILIRILLVLAVSSVAGSHGSPGGLLFLGLPAVAALLISQHGPDGFLARDASGLVRALRWLLGLYAYLGLLTDRFPTGGAEDVVRFDVTPSGEPTTGSALLRLLTSIPAVIALWVLGIVGFVLWLVAAFFVLVTEQYPLAIFDFQCGVLRYHARFLAWHASLVDCYPTTMTEQPSLPGVGPTETHP